MPLYEYRCSCGKEFEALRPIAQRDDVVCSCGQKPTKLISGWGLALIAGTFRVMTEGGKILNEYQSTERTPYPYLDSNGERKFL